MNPNKKSGTLKGSKASASDPTLISALPPAATSILALILLLTLWAYWPKWNHDFTNWDDPIYVSDNTLIRNGSLSDFFTTPVASNYHPFTMLSLALDYKIGGDTPKVYFATNLIFHIANTCILAFILFQLFPQYLFLVLFTIAGFALHPLHVESVAWVSERKDVLYTFFLFLSWLAYLTWENKNKTPILILSLLLFISACLSKGMAVVLPVILIVSTWIRFGIPGKKYYIPLIGFVIVSLIFGIVAIQTQAIAGALSVDTQQLSYVDRIITAIHGYVFYLQKCILPIQLSAYYPYPVNFNQSWPMQYWLSPVILLLIFAIIWIKFRNNKIIVGGMLMYLGILLPVSQIISVGNASTADRYFYLASIGPLLILGFGLDYLIKQRIKSQSMGAVLIAVFCLLMAIGSRSRVAVWQDSVTLFNDVIAQFPEAAVAYHGLGEALNAKEDYAGALKNFELAIKYRPGYPDVLYNIAVVYDRLNRHAESIPFYMHAIQNKPDYVQAHYNVANAYYMIQNYDSSLYYFEKTLVLKPDHTGALNNMASIFFDTRDFDRALEILKRTLEVNPNQEEAIYNIGSIYFQRKAYQEAFSWFEKCIQINPSLADNHRMAGFALSEQGNVTAALPYMQKAASLGDDMAKQWLAQNSPQP
jgi:tetratricopeptide (TPR) repeat protein